MKLRSSLSTVDVSSQKAPVEGGGHWKHWVADTEAVVFPDIKERRHRRHSVGRCLLATLVTDLYSPMVRDGFTIASLWP